MQPQQAQTTREGVGQRRHEEHIRRAGQQKTPGCAFPIHHPLDRGEQPRHALHFIENDPRRQLRQKPARVSGRTGQRHGIVKRQIGIPSGITDGLCKRGLPALPRSVQQDDRCIRQ